MSWTLWLTGPPASGKSTIARELVGRLRAEGVAVAWLESDAMRTILAPEAGYSPDERDAFYAALAGLAAHLSSQGLNVLVDATAPRRAHRKKLQDQAPDLLEVLVEAPLAIREARDPKGLYRKAREGGAPHLPGATEPYEPPERPALVLSGTARPAENVSRILALLPPGPRVSPAAPSKI